MHEHRKLKTGSNEQPTEQHACRKHALHQPAHIELDNTLYLLTAACYKHGAYIDTAERRNTVRNMLLDELDQHGCRVYAWVVVPNHYHVLVQVSRFADLPIVFRRIHGRTARIWNLEDDAAGRKVWYRYTDRVIRSERHYWTTVNYIHFNPVKHGLVDSPYGWEWSSVHGYLENEGIEWLRDLWRTFPVRDYGKSWDNT